MLRPWRHRRPWLFHRSRPARRFAGPRKSRREDWLGCRGPSSVVCSLRASRAEFSVRRCLRASAFARSLPAQLPTAPRAIAASNPARRPRTGDAAEIRPRYINRRPGCLQKRGRPDPRGVFADRREYPRAPGHSKCALSMQGGRIRRSPECVA